MTEEIRNATIERTEITHDDHGFLTAWLFMDYGDSSHQGFGGFGLYIPYAKFKEPLRHHEIPVCHDHMGHFLWRTMEVLGVENWNQMRGKAVRVKIKDGLIRAIGHITKDQWFCPAEDFDYIETYVYQGRLLAEGKHV
jgi:hypothetical protein